MIARLLLASVIAFSAGCTPYVSRSTMTVITQDFESRKATAENDARAGRISWVQAERQIRDRDIEVKKKLDEMKVRHTWRYDDWDAEYYAYVLALAERLDSQQITYLQFDAARTQRQSQIEARRQGLQNQRSAVEALQQRTQICATERVGIPPLDRLETRCR